MNFLLQQYKWISLAFFLLTVLGAWGLRYFAIDASAETLLVKNNLLYLEARSVNQRFNPEEFVLVAYRPHDGNIYSAQSQQDIADMMESFSSLERVEKVVSILNVPLLETAEDLNQDSSPEQLTQQQLQYPEERLRTLLQDHPIYTDLLVNQEQTATALQIVFRSDPAQQKLDARILELDRSSLDTELEEQEQEELKLLRESFAAAELTLKQSRAREISFLYQNIGTFEDHADIFLGGNHVLAYHLIDIIGSDLLVFGSLILGFITILLFVLFRHPVWVLVPLLCCLASVLITAGSFGFLGIKTTVISANFIALQLILTLAIVIHLIVQYQALAAVQPESDHRQLVAATLRHKMRPCLYAGLTTAVGFASLLFSNIQPVISFGWMMMVAMATSILTSLALFPSILLFRKTALPAGRHDVVLHGLARLEQGISKHGTVVLCLSAVLLAGGVYGIGRLSVENSFLDYFRADTQVRKELVFIDQEFGGSTPLDIVYTPPPDARKQDLVLSAKTVQMLQRIQATLESSPTTGKVMSLAAFTSLARSLNAGRPLTEYELNSIYLLLDEELKDSLLGSYLDEESGALRISVRIKDATAGLNRKEFLASLHSSLQALGIESSQLVVTNLFVLYQDILERLYRSQILTMGLVYLVLGLVMVAIFRSLRVGMIALAPNILATTFILGLMGLLGIPLDLMTITIVAIAMGIAVDDTIHFVHQFQEESKADSNKALPETFQKVGYAILMTSVIIMAGFSILAFSSFVPSIYFGLLTAMAMLIALLTDLTLLPVLLEKFMPAQPSPSTQANSGTLVE